MEERRGGVSSARAGAKAGARSRTGPGHRKHGGGCCGILKSIYNLMVVADMKNVIFCSFHDENSLILNI